MDLITAISFIAGLVLLVIGADLLVRGASRLATLLGIPPLVVGLTVVAFGTCAPELAVSIQASLDGRGAMALGNVVGSNILNVLLILGLSATVAPLVVSTQLVRTDVPVMIGASLLVLLLGFDGTISLLDGLLLVAGTIGYAVFLIRNNRKQTTTDHAVKTPAAPVSSGRPLRQSLRNGLQNGGLILGGIVLLVLGSSWLVSGATALARMLGLSELVIGLTVIAAGTGLPEIATSALASWRGQPDIAVGNVVGSNILNILLVLGLTSVVAPDGIPVPATAVRFDILVMLATAVACLPIFFTDGLISRWEGALFLAYYIAYTAYLVLNSAQHAALPAFSTIMLILVIPLTGVTLIVLTWQAVQRRRGQALGSSCIS